MFLSPNIAQAATREEILTIIEQKEQEYNIPSGLLLAVSKTESNLKPFSLNINGKSLFFKQKDAAIRAINEAVSSGITNIDIGVAQVNYKWHQSNFSSIDSMLSPESNIQYAAGLLAMLKTQHGDWHKAVRYYHSTKPEHYRKYSRKVVMCWLAG